MLDFMNIGNIASENMCAKMGFHTSSLEFASNNKIKNYYAVHIYETTPLAEIDVHASVLGVKEPRNYVFYLR